MCAGVCAWHIDFQLPSLDVPKFEPLRAGEDLDPSKLDSADASLASTSPPYPQLQLVSQRERIPPPTIAQFPAHCLGAWSAECETAVAGGRTQPLSQAQHRTLDTQGVRFARETQEWSQWWESQREPRVGTTFSASLGLLKRLLP